MDCITSVHHKKDGVILVHYSEVVGSCICLLFSKAVCIPLKERVAL